MSKRYVLVGTGGRSWMYTAALMGDFREYGDLLAFCDVNQHRMDFNNQLIHDHYEHDPLPTYRAHEFDRMIEEHRPDTVIVTSIDRTHHRYICRAMELGCDAISEKPMTVDADKCQQIVDTVERTGKHLTVTFNYRYAPRNTKVKEILKSGVLGRIVSVHFEWLLDTSHGADYFRRWHRDKRNSGGLMVHKATHHFDLVNWWLDASPDMVYAQGNLRFYGRENAEERGVSTFYNRSRHSAAAAADPFALKVGDGDRRMHGLYYDAEAEDGYFRDQSVFGDGISIEDTMSVMARYTNRAVMTYSLNAFCPWEGYRVCFNGTQGRLEFNVVESAQVTAGQVEDFTMPGMREVGADRKTMVPEIILQPLWGEARAVDYDEGDRSGHGGGDARLLRDIFVGVQDNGLGHAADYIDGAKSILTGIAANRSMQTGLPVQVRDLVRLPALFRT